MMRSARIGFLTLCTLLIAAQARAHFVWVQVTGTEPARQVCVWFSETPEPGAARLVDKMAAGGAEAWLAANDKRTALPLSKMIADETGGLVAPLPSAAQGDFIVAAHWCYGVFRRDGEPFLLQYYAKHAGGPAAKAVDAPLDIVARDDAGALVLEVQWQGQPLADAMVVVQPPSGDALEQKTDAAGQIKLASPAHGAYAIRAEHVEADKSGSHGDQDYTHVRHYATLTMALGGAAPATTAPASAADAESATALLAKARAARAVWHDFPGMSARLHIVADGQAEDAELTLHGNGQFELTGSDSLGAGWAKTQLRILVQHRMPDGGLGDEAHFADQDTSHPLGRLIVLEGEDLDSAYRIDGDVVAEVNRTMGKTRFTISVLKVARNAEGHYLPEAFTVSYWDKESGKMRSAETLYNSWTRIAGFDLPEKIMGVLSKDGARHVFEIDFTDHKLLGEGPAAQASNK